MKKIISFKKNIEFPSMIGEVTAISLDHTLKFIDESNIAGDFRVTGSYKLTEASRLEENFDYTIPTEIVLPEKLDLETTKISIADFYYEIDSDVTMICYIDVKIEGVEIIEELEEKEETIEEKKSIEPTIPSTPKEEQETRCIEEETKNERECDGDKIMEETSEEKVEITPNETVANTSNENIEKTATNNNNNDNELSEKTGSLFTSLDSSEETFSTYSVYILRQEETVQSIIEKYHISKEELENYNDLSNLSVGTKIIIPNTQND